MRIFSGIGASLTVSHSDAIIIQYFRLKYDAVSTVLQVGRAAGFVLLPFAIERFTLEARLLETTAVYQLLGMIACLTFSKPQYVSENKEKYNIIQVSKFSRLLIHTYVVQVCISKTKDVV